MNTPFFPGRVRLRFTQLRQAPGRLARVCADLGGVTGVTSVSPSPLTGGVLIHYAPAAGTMARFWDELESVLLAHHLDHMPRGWAREVPAAAAPRRGGAAALSVRRLSGGVAGALFERIVERSALALVVALL